MNHFCTLCLLSTASFPANDPVRCAVVRVSCWRGQDLLQQISHKHFQDTGQDIIVSHSMEYLWNCNVDLSAVLCCDGNDSTKHEQENKWYTGSTNLLQTCKPTPLYPHPPPNCFRLRVNFCQACQHSLYCNCKNLPRTDMAPSLPSPIT